MVERRCYGEACWYSRPGSVDHWCWEASEIFGAHTWVTGKGIRLDTERSYVLYQLSEAMTNGEFSVEVEGLHPGGPNHKLKIFSMNNSSADPSFSDNYMSTMYRGLDGNPPNCIAFKAVFGSQSRIAEPVSSERTASIRTLDPGAHVFLESDLGQRVQAACPRRRYRRQLNL